MLRNYSYYTSPGRILQSGFYRGNYPGDRQLYCWAYANYKRNNHVYFKILNEELTAEDMQFLILHRDFLYVQMEVKDDEAWLTLAFKI